MKTGYVIPSWLWRTEDSNPVFTQKTCVREPYEEEPWVNGKTFSVYGESGTHPGDQLSESLRVPVIGRRWQWAPLLGSTYRSSYFEGSPTSGWRVTDVYVLSGLRSWWVVSGQSGPWHCLLAFNNEDRRFKTPNDTTLSIGLQRTGEPQI